MPFAAEPPVINEAATAFMLIASSMVLLMTPGLALFYGGMTRAKSVLNMMMMSFGALAVVGIIYVLWGYSMSFGNLQDGTGDIGGLFANPFHLFGLGALTGDDGARLIDLFGVGVFIPEYIYVGFQLTFAVITVALISGAIADRVKFSHLARLRRRLGHPRLLPDRAHGLGRRAAVRRRGRPLGQALRRRPTGSPTSLPIDFAGGTVVHINAGIAGLALALIVGKRLGFGKDGHAPPQPAARHDRRRPAVVRLVRLQRRLRARRRRPRLRGLAQHDGRHVRRHARLAARGEAPRRPRRPRSVPPPVSSPASSPSPRPVAPCRRSARSSSASSPVRLSALAVGLKYRFGYDDSLDVVGVHLVAGLWGTIGAGLLATSTGSVLRRRLRADGPAGRSSRSSRCVISGVLTASSRLTLKYTIGWRITRGRGAEGIDQAEHAESGYDLGGFAAGPGAASIPRPPSRPRQAEGANA